MADRIRAWLETKRVLLFVFGVSMWRLYALSNTNDIKLLRWSRLAIVSNRRFLLESDLVLLPLGKYQIILASSTSPTPIMVHNPKVQDVC
jgi:hypothetical protein